MEAGVGAASTAVRFTRIPPWLTSTGPTSSTESPSALTALRTPPQPTLCSRRGASGIGAPSAGAEPFDTIPVGLVPASSAFRDRDVALTPDPLVLGGRMPPDAQ